MIDRRVALPAFDLREIALGGAGILRQLPARHAALGAREPHQPSDRGGEVVRAVGASDRCSALDAGALVGCGIRAACDLAFGSAARGYSESAL